MMTEPAAFALGERVTVYADPDTRPFLRRFDRVPGRVYGHRRDEEGRWSYLVEFPVKLRWPFTRVWVRRVEIARLTEEETP